jgi:hypothetical protein
MPPPFLLVAFFLLPSYGLGATYDYPTSPNRALKPGWIEINLLDQYKGEIAKWERALGSRNISQKEKWRRVHHRIKEANEEELSKLKGFQYESKGNEKLSGVSEGEALALVNALRTHPIVSDTASKKYDTRFSSIGFCFGRAAYVHRELLRKGVDPSKIFKVFAIGPLVFQGKRWDFHVTTIVRNRAGGWWAIDGLSEKPSSLEDWQNQVHSYSYEKEFPYLRFYVTDAIKFRPLPGAYSAAALDEKIYQGFFRELENWFERNPAIR